MILGLPTWLCGKESACQCRRHKRLGFNPWARKIPWRRKWKPTPVFLPQKSHVQRRLVGCSPWGCRVRHDWDWTCTHTLYYFIGFVAVESLDCVQLFVTPWTAAHWASCPSQSPGSWLKLMSIELVMLTNHLHCPLLPSVFPSIRVFSNESALHITWPKYWNCSFSVSSSSEYSGLISFRIDWFDLLQSKGLSRVFSSTTVQKHLLWCSVCFMIQISHVYMTTGKTIALTIRAFVGKVMYLLFNTEHCILKGKS